LCLESDLHIHQLTDLTWDKTIGSGGDWLVGFLSSKCRHCRDLKTEWKLLSERVATESRGVSLAVVDLGNRDNIEHTQLVLGPVHLTPTFVFWRGCGAAGTGRASALFERGCRRWGTGWLADQRATGLVQLTSHLGAHDLAPRVESRADLAVLLARSDPLVGCDLTFLLVGPSTPEQQDIWSTVVAELFPAVQFAFSNASAGIEATYEVDEVWHASWDGELNYGTASSALAVLALASDGELEASFMLSDDELAAVGVGAIIEQWRADDTDGRKDAWAGPSAGGGVSVSLFQFLRVTSAVVFQPLTPSNQRALLGSLQESEVGRAGYKAVATLAVDAEVLEAAGGIQAVVRGYQRVVREAAAQIARESGYRLAWNYQVVDVKRRYFFGLHCGHRPPAAGELPLPCINIHSRMSPFARVHRMAQAIEDNRRMFEYRARQTGGASVFLTPLGGLARPT
jgi:hypothetical protein